MHSTQPSPSGGVSMSGGSPGFGGSRSGSTGSGSGSGPGSRRHSKAIAVSGDHGEPSVVSSSPWKTNVAEVLPVPSGGASSITAVGGVMSTGAIGGGGAARPN